MKHDTPYMPEEMAVLHKQRAEQLASEGKVSDVEHFRTTSMATLNILKAKAPQ
jgi:hypothetical protein